MVARIGGGWAATFTAQPEFLFRVGESAKAGQCFATAIDVFHRFTLPWEEADTFLFGESTVERK